MTVYVDKLPDGWGKWSGGAHMLATDLNELHGMARQIGLRTRWFQDKGTFPHYDLTPRKRMLALTAGAVEIETGEIPGDVLVKCSDGSYETRAERRRRNRRI
jgi:Protein of unknown function (DUF4031)